MQVVTVTEVAEVSPRLVRVRFSGASGFDGVQPAASLRLLVPTGDDLVMPAWNGNEYLLPDGTRPPVRTLTPLPVAGGGLDVEVVVHGNGPASDWAQAARVGQRAALSGPGRGYEVPDAARFVIVGDESAIPAIGQLLAALPARAVAASEVHVEVASPSAQVDLPADVHWHVSDRPGEALVAAVSGATIDDGTRVWVAGEAAAVQRARRHLFDERGVPRAMTWVRGYWKHGRAADDSADELG
jgi:NADPH-dependent ferric siderophore reductase